MKKVTFNLKKSGFSHTNDMQAYLAKVTNDSYCWLSLSTSLLSNIIVDSFCLPFIVDCLLSTVYYRLFTVNCLWSSLIVDSYCRLSIVDTLLLTLYGRHLLSTLHCSPHLTLYCMSTPTIDFFCRIFIIDSLL